MLQINTGIRRILMIKQKPIKERGKQRNLQLRDSLKQRL